MIERLNSQKKQNNMRFQAFRWLSACLKTIESLAVPLVKSSLVTACLTTLLGITTVTLVGFVSSAKNAMALTIYPFDTVYDLQEVLTPIPRTNFIDALVLGYNPDAPYGLTNYMLKTYVKPDFETSTLTFNSDPATFGLEGFPVGSVVYSGSSANQLFGSSAGNAKPDPTTGTMMGFTTNTITGGTGEFDDASGTINVIQIDSIPKAFSNGVIQTPQTVPEPTATPVLISLGLTGASLLLRRQRYLQST